MTDGAGQIPAPSVIGQIPSKGLVVSGDGNVADRSRVHFYFDYLSPYAYLAHTQLRRLSAPISYHPVDIRRVMQDTGNVPTSVICKPKNRYIQADLRRWADYYDVPLQRHPRAMELDSNRLLRATLHVRAHVPADDVVTALFHALWVEPQPLDTAYDVARIIRRAGFDDSALKAGMDGPECEDALKLATAEATARGVFGAPCMFVGDEMFFGNDRLDFVKARLERAA